MEEVFIVSAVRTATGKFLGALKGFKATELGAHRRPQDAAGIGRSHPIVGRQGLG